MPCVPISALYNASVNRHWTLLVFVLAASRLIAQSVTPESQKNIASPKTKPGAAATADSAALVPVHVISPSYPFVEGSLANLKGLVVLRAMIAETGDVESIAIVSGDPVLAQAAVDAVKEWKFRPFIKNGKPVRIPAVLPFNFIMCEGPTTSTAAEPTAVGAMKIVAAGKGCNVRVVKRVDPTYPDIAKASHIQGGVALFLVIGKDGSVRQVSVINGDPLLIQASVDAVKQWRYSPLILDGEPVEWQTVVNVAFSLSG